MDALIQKAVKLGLLNEDVKIKVGISGSVQVLGTFEGCLDEEGWPKISSAKLALLFSGGVSYTQNYLIGTVPMYFTASLQASLESAIQACMNDQGQLEPQDISQPGVYSMAFTLGITVENGVGNPQILSGGVQGSGNLKVQFNLPYDSNHTAWSLNASAAFVGSLLGYASGSWVFWNSKELILYQDGQLLPDSGVATLAALDLADVEWVQAGRDYLDKPSAFTANDSLSLLVEEDGQLASAVLQSNVYPYTVPRIAVYSYREGSERTAAVWLQDVTGRSDENRTALYYSTYNGYYWDTPQMVPTGSQTADFAPTLQVVDNQAVALWMKADTVLESGIDVEETASHMEIAYGALGSGTYRTIGLEGLDMLPVLWKDGQGIQIAFVHCPDGLFGEEMEIWRYTEATGEYTLLAEGLSGVDALAVDDGGTLYYSVSREGAQSLYRLTASGGSQRMGDGGKPVWACDRLWWYDGGMVRSTAGDAVPTLAGSDWFLPLEFGGRQAVLFRGGREDGGTILSLSLKDGDWQQPIPLLETEEYLSDVSASASAQTGKLAILANRQTMGEGYEITQADLVYWQVTPGMDLAVTAATYDGTTLIPGEALRVSLQVANRGTEAASLFQVDLYDGETLVSTAYAKEELPSGGSILLTADLPLPETLPGSVTLQVTPLMADEVSPEDNRIPLELRLADVSVEEIAAQTAGDGTVETVVRVVNRGQNTLTDLPVSLHGGAEDGPEAAERQTITSLAPGDVAVLSFVSAAGALEEGGLVYAVVQLTQEQQAVENLLANNTGFAMVQSGVTEADTRFRVYAGTAAENGRASVVVSVENNSGEAVAVSYYIALYQSDGRMVEATTTGLITVEAGERRTAAELTVPYARGLTAKVFVLDGDSRPLLPAWSGAVGEAEDT